MSTAEEREARRKRAQAQARRAGNARKTQQKTTEPQTIDTSAALVVSSGGAESVPELPTKLIEPDTPARQARAAAARVEAAEHARRAKTAPVVPPKAKTAPPTRTSSTSSTSSTSKAARREPKARARTTEPVTPVSVDEAVKHMAFEHIQCRDFGHSWRPYSARWMPTFNQYESQLMCARCKTIRTRFMSRTGALLDSKYDYADGYTVKGLGRLSGVDRDVIRLQSILGVLVEDTAE